MRKYLRNYMTAISIALALLLSFSAFSFAGDDKALFAGDGIASNRSGIASDKARNIIFMVPDGMGLSNVTAARIFKNGPNGDALYMETLPQIGYQRTHSKNSTVTDSAAAGSAWACGMKFNNGEICCLDDDRNGICESAPNTILELAKAKGKATGLVATSTITHATPAAFGAHVHFRNCETEIARQYIEEIGVDVMLGGGIGSDRAECLTPSPKTATQLITEAQSSYGYTYVTDKTQMAAAVAASKIKILGLFTAGGKTPETYHVVPSLTYPVAEPTLPEMTVAALNILEKDREGFFLMVEGSQIDWANHANNINYQIGETLAFDEAVKVVLDWVNKNPLRKRNTLVIIVSDHDCGGFAVNGPYGTLSEAGDIVEAGWTSGNHTAGDTIIWSQGPGSQHLGKAVDNTYLYDVMKNVLN